MELLTLFYATQVSKVFAFWTDNGLPVKKKNKYLFSLHLQLGMQSHIPLTPKHSLTSPQKPKSPHINFDPWELKSVWS